MKPLALVSIVISEAKLAAFKVILPAVVVMLPASVLAPSPDNLKAPVEVMPAATAVVNMPALAISTLPPLLNAGRVQKRSATLTLRYCVAMKTKYKHLNCEERILIQLSLEKGCTIRAIALSLDRSASSVSRELARNNWCSPQAQAFRLGRPALAGGYRAVLAQQRASVARSSGRKPPLLASDGFLWAQVQKLLKQRYSPEQIAGILPRMYPDDLSMRPDFFNRS